LDFGFFVVIFVFLEVRGVGLRWKNPFIGIFMTMGHAVGVIVIDLSGRLKGTDCESFLRTLKLWMGCTMCSAHESFRKSKRFLMKHIGREMQKKTFFSKPFSSIFSNRSGNLFSLLKRDV
jgi:hypothetical protein